MIWRVILLKKREKEILAEKLYYNNWESNKLCIGCVIFRTILHNLVQKLVLTYMKSFLLINFLNFSSLQYMKSLFHCQFQNSGTTQIPERGGGTITNQSVWILAWGSCPGDSVALYSSPEKKVTETRKSFSF